MENTVIHWFRRDLRLTDNTALSQASRSGCPIIPVFILDPTLYANTRTSVPRFAFLLNGLRSLDRLLRERGTRLIVLRGNPREVLPALVSKMGAIALYFNRDYSPLALRRDRAVANAVGVPVRQFDDALLVPPNLVLTDSGSPYSVFTPFKNKWLTIPKSPLMGTLPENIRWATGFSSSADLFAWERVPDLSDLRPERVFDLPESSEGSAQKHLDEFVSTRVFNYSEGRNALAPLSADRRSESSFLSPYLRFGLLSPRQAYWAAREAYQSVDLLSAGRKGKHESVETWVSELVWRDFYIHILYHFPHVIKGSFREKYDRLEWRHAPAELEAWKFGLTGYPVVDAAMRQLRTTGWMPNRSRMIVASFLTKDLLISWQEGERHFMDWLIDGDPAANNGGWQWSAGTGTDAQPYFRIFNPIQQSKDYDPDGTYIRQWVPELRDIPDRYLHTPHEWGRAVEAYPKPIVEHRFARERTLAAFKSL